MNDLISRAEVIEWYCKSECESKYCGIPCREVEEMQGLPPASPRWIPVTERLPEYGTQVLSTNKDDDYEINHIIDEEDGEWFYNGVVAWMPLPQPWKGADDER